MQNKNKTLVLYYLSHPHTLTLNSYYTVSLLQSIGEQKTNFSISKCSTNRYAPNADLCSRFPPIFLYHHLVPCVTEEVSSIHFSQQEIPFVPVHIQAKDRQTLTATSFTFLLVGKARIDVTGLDGKKIRWRSDLLFFQHSWIVAVTDFTVEIFLQFCHPFL